MKKEKVIVNRMGPILIYCNEKKPLGRDEVNLHLLCGPFKPSEWSKRIMVSNMKLTDRVNEAMAAGDFVLILAEVNACLSR